MKSRLHPLLLLVALIPFAAAFAQPTEQAERAALSSLLALGRVASPAESVDAKETDKATLPALIARHRERLQGDAALQRTVVERACEDAFGRKPTDAEMATWSKGAPTYLELLQRHIAWLSAHPEEYQQVINRAYQLVINRPAYDLEFDYWRPRAALPYVLLVGAIENWGQRNQPGLMVTNGTPSISINSRYLVTLRLSRAVANEARTLIGLPVWSDVARLKNPDYHVVAPGSSELASVGGIHFAAVGGGVFSGR